MKLLVVGHSYVTSFAQEKFVTMKALRRDLRLRLLVPDRAYNLFGAYKAERHEELGVEELVVMRRLGGRSHMGYLLNPLRLARLLRTFRPDVVLIEEDPHSLIGVETVLLLGLFSPDAKITFFIWDNLARRPRFPLNLIKRGLAGYSFARTSLVICGNTEGRSLLKKKGYLGPSTVVPQIGVREPRTTRERGESPPLIGFVGRLVPEKGVLLLLHALAGLEEFEWKLLIVGAGPLEEELRTFWRRRFGSRLVLRNAVPHADVESILQSLDIFVLPSYGVPGWKEQFGLTLAQAMMAGAACVGSSSGAIPEVLGAAGVVFLERDEAALRDALRSLLKSEDRRKILARAAKQRATQQYSMTAIASKFLSGLQSVVPHAS
jgi:glycosyltransferase involved in cell wall biosynthesis